MPEHELNRREFAATSLAGAASLAVPSVSSAVGANPLARFDFDPAGLGPLVRNLRATTLSLFHSRYDGGKELSAGAWTDFEAGRVEPLLHYFRVTTAKLFEVARTLALHPAVEELRKPAANPHLQKALAVLYDARRSEAAAARAAIGGSDPIPARPTHTQVFELGLRVYEDGVPASEVERYRRIKEKTFWDTHPLITEALGPFELDRFEFDALVMELEWLGVRDIDSFIKEPRWTEAVAAHVDELIGWFESSGWQTILAPDCRWVRENPSKLRDLVKQLRTIVRECAFGPQKSAYASGPMVDPMAISDTEFWTRVVHDGEDPESLVMPAAWNDSGWDD